MTQQRNELEVMLDARGLYAVLDELSGMCGQKAEHVLANWHDAGLAGQWEAAEAVLDAAASKVLDLNLDGKAVQV